jgi:hypothetical protein
MAEHHSSPIFIVGAPRSGTTLLQFRLRNHPRLSLPTGESHFLVPLYVHQDAYKPLDKIENIQRVLELMWKKSREFLETDLHGMRFDMPSLARELHENGCDTLPKIISWLFSKNAAGEGKARWGDKTPYYVLHIPKILDWFPDAQIIHIVRDGRDVALSLFERRHDFFIYNAYSAAQSWKHYVEVGHKIGSTLPPDQYLEIRYEDLIAEPEQVLKDICAFLGEAFDPTLFNTKTPQDLGKTPLVHAPIKNDNREKWRQAMTPGQVRVFEAIAGQTLTDHGYHLATNARKMILPTKLAYTLHNRLLEDYWRYRLSKPRFKNFKVK